MPLPLVYTGQFAGDGTGDPGKVAFDKINAWIANLAASINSGTPVSLNYASTTLSADTANFTLGGSFPSGITQMDFLLTTQNVNLSGLQAGVFNGQVLWLRNAPTSTFTLFLNVENVGSSTANRFSGPTWSIALIAGFKVPAVYNTTLARWVV